MTTTRDMFQEFEQAITPILIAHSRKLANATGMPMDDALQEGRIALFRAMGNYDFNKSRGGIHRFAHTVLRNNALSIMYSQTTTPRVPHTLYKEGGKIKVLRHRMVALDEIPEDGRATYVPPSTDPGPEAELHEHEAATRRHKLVMRLYSKLGARERKVFDCKCRPSEAFLVYLRNIGMDEPTHAAIAKYIGVSKNAVDYSAHTIRDTFTKLAEQEFPDVIEGHTASGAWPMIHISRSDKPDHDFIRKIIEEKGLDPRPIDGRDIEKSGESAREIQMYPWGAVLILKRGDQIRTLVIEGRFNKNTGGVFGTIGGTHKSVADVVPWYAALHKELAA